MENFNDTFFEEIKDPNKKGNKEEIKKDSSTLIKIIEQKDKQILQYQSYELDNQILHIYTRAIGNLSGEKYSKLTLVKDNKIKNINISEIETIIENLCLDINYFSYEELCFVNIILLFTISLKYLPKNFGHKSFLLQNFLISRKNIVILLELLYKLFIQSEKENNNDITNRIKSCFYSCFDYIIKQNVIPNENLMNLVNNFFQLFSEKENENDINEINIIKENEEKNEINIINANDELNFNITKKNLYTYNNFSSIQFHSENYIVQKTNELETGKFIIRFNGKIEHITPRLRFVKNKNEKIETIFICQKDIYKILLIEYQKFSTKLDINELNKKNILNSCLNIFAFIRNSDVFGGLEEIFKIMENIFYIFLRNN